MGSTATLTHDVTAGGAHLNGRACSTSSRPAMHGLDPEGARLLLEKH